MQGAPQERHHVLEAPPWCCSSGIVFEALVSDPLPRREQPFRMFLTEEASSFALHSGLL